MTGRGRAPALRLHRAYADRRQAIALPTGRRSATNDSASGVLGSTQGGLLTLPASNVSFPSIKSTFPSYLDQTSCLQVVPFLASKVHLITSNGPRMARKRHLSWLGNTALPIWRMGVALIQRSPGRLMTLVAHLDKSTRSSNEDRLPL